MATSHAAGCWAAPAAGRGAPAMLHPCTVRAMLSLLGQGLCCDALRGGGHQAGGG